MSLVVCVHMVGRFGSAWYDGLCGCETACGDWQQYGSAAGIGYTDLGLAEPGEKVTVTFNGKTKQATADALGRWTIGT